MILLGSFASYHALTAVAATGVILSAVYMLWMFQRVNYGTVTNEKNRALPDLSPREWAMMVPTIAMCIFMGVFPNVFLRPMEASVRKVVDQVHGVRAVVSAASVSSAGRPASRVPRPASGGGR